MSRRAGAAAVVALLALVEALLGASACSGGGAASPDGGGAGTDGATLATCQQIRLCVAETPCATADCVQACAAKGSPTARAAFEALRACTEGLCAVSDVTCSCDEQCLADGHCTTQVDECLSGLAADDICDNLCH